MFDENISADQIIEPGGTICVGAKFLGDPHMRFLSEWVEGKRAMLAGIHAMLSEADAVVTYNGDKFDLPVLNGEFVLAGMRPPPPIASIDVYKTVRQFRLGIHRLAYVGPLLKVGEKVKHEGFSLWSSVMAGDPKAQRRMARYCKQDVRLLERLYLRVLPFIKNHPHLGSVSSRACSSCGSGNVVQQGTRRTRLYEVQRFQCRDCGSWHQGKRSKI